MTLPLRSSPITGPSSLLRVGPPLCPASVPNPSQISRLEFSLPPAAGGHNRSTGRPRARNDRFPRSTPKPGPSSRHLHAGHHLANKQAPARLIPGWAGHPVSMSSNAAFDTSSVDRSRSPSWPTPDALTARLSPRTLTTTALDRSSSGRFAASPRRAAAEDHQPIGLAPPSPVQHRTNSPIFYIDLLMRSWHTLPGCVLPESPCPGSGDRKLRTGQQPSGHDFHAPICSSTRQECCSSTNASAARTRLSAR
jgi:hypothetical protein